MVELEVKCHKLDSSINLWFLPDTGAKIDAIPYKDFHEGYPGVKLQHANTPHTATGTPIRNEGKFPATLEQRLSDGPSVAPVKLHPSEEQLTVDRRACDEHARKTPGRRTVHRASNASLFF